MNRIIYYALAVCLLAAPSGANAQGYPLTRCQEMALENNYRIKNSRLNIEAAAETRKEAFSHYFPSIQAVGTTFHSEEGLAKAKLQPGKYITPNLAAILPPELLGMIPSTFTFSMMDQGMMVGVTATQPVFAGRRIVNSNKLAGIGEQVSVLQLDLTEREVVAQTNEYFWQIVSLREKLLTIGTVESLLENLHKDVASAVRAGIITRNDLLRVELQMQETQSMRFKVENGLSVCRMALAQFIGAEQEGFDIEYGGAADLRLPEYYRVDTDQAVHNRTESRLLDQSVDAARLQRKITSGERMPSMAVGGGYVYNNLLGPANNAGVIYATVSVPISGWWGGSHAHRRQRLVEQQAINQRQDGLELMAVEINQTWNEVNEAYRQILLAGESIASSTENLRIVTNSYKAGTVALTDVLDAQLLFQQSKDQHTDAYTDYQNKLLKYRQITGGN